MFGWLAGRRRGDNLTGWALVGPVVILLALVVYLPALTTFMNSLQFYSLRMPDRAEFVGLDNYLQLLGSAEFWEVTHRSFLLVAMVLPIEMLVAFGGALLLNERFPGRGVVRTLAILPWVLPPLANGFLWGWLLNGQYGALNGLLYQLGLISTYRYWLQDPAALLFWVAIVQTWTRYALPMVILLAGLQFIPDALYEAAAIDGAGAWKRLVHITLPLVRPSLVLALTLEFIATFQIFEVIWTMMGGGGAAGSIIDPFTKTLMVLNYEVVYRRLDIGTGSALSYLILIVSVASGYLLVNRSRRSGAVS